MNASVIAWVRYDRRPELLGQHLGAPVHYASVGKRDSLLRAPGRYLAQGRKTWQILQRERPDVVFAQNPPIFCALVAAAYAGQNGARYVIDAHTGAFTEKWKWSVGIQRRLAKNAAAILVPNQNIAQLTRSWDCPTVTLGFTPGEYPDVLPAVLSGSYNLAVISTGASDEPLGLVFEAARALPDVTFHVTGDASRIKSEVLARRPSNCRQTGFLPYKDYVSLLKGVDAIVDLTTRDNTLLMGAYEAISLGTPLITSDWPILREYFTRGTVHVPNTTAGLLEGIRRTRAAGWTLHREIVQLRDELERDWDVNFAKLQRILGVPVPAPRATPLRRAA